MNPNHPLVIVLLGPTASGKTALGIEIAEKLNLSIHNIDSRQIYLGMDIGTAKPSEEEQRRVRHYLLDLTTPNRPVTLNEFKKSALQSLKKVLQEKNVALLVGGSGLYLKSLTSGLMPPEVPPQYDLRHQLSKFTPKECHAILETCDPMAAEKIFPSDSMRIIRALEVFYVTGKPITSQQKAEPPEWNILELGLNPKNLQQRIIQRTKQIYKDGLINETKQLIKKYSEELPLLKTIGYEEALENINGELDIEEAIHITTRRTKQFAKRQKTWFRNKHKPIWLNNEQPLRESLSLIQDSLGCIN